MRERLNQVWVYALPVALVVIPTVAYGIAAAGIYRSSSRFEAAGWIERNIPEGAGVLTERGGYPTAWMAPADRYKRRLDEAAWFLSADGNMPYEAHVEFIENRLAGVDWIVLIEENRTLPFRNVRRRFPIAHTYYRRLVEQTLGFERVAQFKIAPEILGFTYSEADAEPTVTGFDHPRVVVYRRTGANVRELLDRWKADIRTDPALPDKYVIDGVDAYRRKDWKEAERAFKRSLRVKPEFALGRLLLREVYLAQGRRADAKRELRRIADSGLTAGAYVGMVRVGLVARGAMYLNKYLELSKVKQSDDTVLQQYGWLIHKINAEQSAGRDEPVQASESKTPTAN